MSDLLGTQIVGFPTRGLIVTIGVWVTLCLYFQWQSKASQLESSLNQVQTAQLTDQQRLVTMTKVFSDKLTGLDADVKSAKTVLSLLLNRSVATTRKLKEMDGIAR